ncbi:MAG: hypothetical protein V4474_01845 [Patescibacteria group bacterium]
MGKRRDAIVRKIEAFEAEMAEYSKTHGAGYTFSLNKRVHRSILEIARTEQRSVDSILEDLRPGIKKLIDDPTRGTPLSEWSPEQFAQYLKATGKLH